jgi:hypothetical protein
VRCGRPEVLTSRRNTSTRLARLPATPSPFRHVARDGLAAGGRTGIYLFRGVVLLHCARSASEPKVLSPPSPRWTRPTQSPGMGLQHCINKPPFRRRTQERLGHRRIAGIVIGPPTLSKDDLKYFVLLQIPVRLHSPRGAQSPLGRHRPRVTHAPAEPHFRSETSGWLLPHQSRSVVLTRAIGNLRHGTAADATHRRDLSGVTRHSGPIAMGSDREQLESPLR